MENKNNNINRGILIMRITTGLFFIIFGIMKFTNLSGFSQKYLSVFGSLSLIIAILVGIGELGAGLGLLFGYYTKFSLYILSLIMFGSIFLAHNFFIDSSQMLTGLVRIVLIGYYIGLAQFIPDKKLF